MTIWQGSRTSGARRLLIVLGAVSAVHSLFWLAALLTRLLSIAAGDPALPFLLARLLGALAVLGVSIALVLRRPTSAARHR